jgi:hypothetical protein
MDASGPPGGRALPSPSTARLTKAKRLLPGGRDLFDHLLRAVRGHRPPPPMGPLERITRPSMSAFAALRKQRRPVLLDGLADDWPARTNWTLPQLKERFGNRRVAVIPTEDGRLCGDSETGIAFETLRFGDFVDQLARNERPPHYLAAPPDIWLPELRDDVIVPAYCRDAPWQNSRFWLSAAETAAPLHRDVAQNIFFQIVGRKRFYLYPPSASPWLYSHPLRSALPNYSRFDRERPDYDRYPLSREVQPLEIVLAPGDALYLPSRWWHQVRSLEVSASINFWWADGVLAYAVRAAEWAKNFRKLEIYQLNAGTDADGAQSK